MAVPRHAFKRSLKKLYDYIDLELVDGALPIPDTAEEVVGQVLQISSEGDPEWTPDVVLDSVDAQELTIDGDDVATEDYVDAAVVSGVGLTTSGVAATGVTAVESGSGHYHTTVLTVNTVLPDIAGGAALSVGKLLYTLPAGALVVNCSNMNLSITQTDGNITADTPDGGLGTTIAAGANATLNLTSGAENILTGQTFNDCDGTAEVKTVADQVLVIESAGNHTVYFNVADTWAASGDDAAALAGTVTLNWVKL